MWFDSKIGNKREIGSGNGSGFPFFLKKDYGNSTKEVYQKTQYILNLQQSIKNGIKNRNMGKIKYNCNEHKDYARDLYLTIDANGNQKNNCGQIATLVNKNFGQNYHRSTIKRWAEKHGWDKEYRQMRQHGVERSEDPDRELLDKKTKDITDLYEVTRGMNVESTSQLWERLKAKKLTNKELLDLHKQTQQTILELNDAKDNKADLIMKLSFTEEELERIEGEIYTEDNIEPME